MESENSTDKWRAALEESRKNINLIREKELDKWRAELRRCRERYDLIDSFTKAYDISFLRNLLTGKMSIFKLSKEKIRDFKI